MLMYRSTNAGGGAFAPFESLPSTHSINSGSERGQVSIKGERSFGPKGHLDIDKKLWITEVIFQGHRQPPVGGFITNPFAYEPLLFLFLGL